MNKTDLDRIVRVEVSAEPVIPGRSGQNERGPWTIPAKQVCYIHQGETYPTRIEIAFDREPRKPGFYLLAGTPFVVTSVNDRVRISFSDRNLDLVPVEAAANIKVAA